MDRCTCGTYPPTDCGVHPERWRTLRAVALTRGPDGDAARSAIRRRGRQHATSQTATGAATGTPHTPRATTPPPERGAVAFRLYFDPDAHRVAPLPPRYVRRPPPD